LPGYVYDRFGWGSMILVFALILVFTAWYILQLRLDTNRQ